MKRLTLNQYRVLLSGKPTTRIKAARQLSDLGLIEITGKVWAGQRQHYKPRLAVTFTVTERGREEMELARSYQIASYDLSRNREAYERHEKGESWPAIGHRLGIDRRTAQGLAETWVKYRDVQ